LSQSSNIVKELFILLNKHKGQNFPH